MTRTEQQDAVFEALADDERLETHEEMCERLGLIPGNVTPVEIEAWGLLYQAVKK